jgi:predicted MPP superfamily phosphohydrolase
MSTPNWKQAAALLFGAGFVYSLIEPHQIVVREFDVALPNLPRKTNGLKIAQLSDLHCSALTSPAFIARAVDICNSLQPDVVALTGDFVSRRNSYSHVTGARVWAAPIMEYARAVAGVLRALQAPDGIFAVPGNHDHSKGNCNAIMDLLQENGVTPLVNGSTPVREVLPIVGLDDLRAGRPLLKKAFKNVAPESAQVVLSHNPRLLPSISNRNALMLSGHTHAGQVLLPVVPIRVKPSDVGSTPHLKGWYRQGRAQLYVNPGLGSVHFPMRFACPPEISVFTLRGE